MTRWIPTPSKPGLAWLALLPLLPTTVFGLLMFGMAVLDLATGTRVGPFEGGALLASLLSVLLLAVYIGFGAWWHREDIESRSLGILVAASVAVILSFYGTVRPSSPVWLAVFEPWGLLIAVNLIGLLQVASWKMPERWWLPVCSVPFVLLMWEVVRGVAWEFLGFSSMRGLGGTWTPGLIVAVVVFPAMLPRAVGTMDRDHPSDPGKQEGVPQWASAVVTVGTLIVSLQGLALAFDLPIDPFHLIHGGFLPIAYFMALLAGPVLALPGAVSILMTQRRRRESFEELTMSNQVLVGVASLWVAIGALVLVAVPWAMWEFGRGFGV